MLAGESYVRSSSMFPFGRLILGDVSHGSFFRFPFSCISFSVIFSTFAAFVFLFISQSLLPFQFFVHFIIVSFVPSHLSNLPCPRLLQIVSNCNLNFQFSNAALTSVEISSSSLVGKSFLVVFRDRSLLASAITCSPPKFSHVVHTTCLVGHRWD